jgi:hypothetical protein
MDDAIQRKVARRKAGSKTSKASKKKSLLPFPKAAYSQKKKSRLAHGAHATRCARGPTSPRKPCSPTIKCPLVRCLSLHPPPAQPPTHPPRQAANRRGCHGSSASQRRPHPSAPPPRRLGLAWCRSGPACARAAGTDPALHQVNRSRRSVIRRLAAHRRFATNHFSSLIILRRCLLFVSLADRDGVVC